MLLVAGLFFLYKFHDFPSFHNAPNGMVRYTHKVFFHIFGMNGWSAELTAAAGGALLIGAAQHWLAKFSSFVVMVALGGVAIWALVHHHSALGLFAASIWTIILWGAAAVFLLFNVFLPRRSSQAGTETAPARGRTAPAVAQPAPRAPAYEEPTRQVDPPSAT